MQKNLRSRWIGLTVFALLTAALVLVITQVDLGGEAEDDATPTPDLALFPGAESQVVIAIQVTNHETGQSLSASTEDGLTWAIDQAPEDADLSLPVDSIRISQAVIAIPGLTASRVLSAVEALAPYGLEDARYTVQARLSGGDEQTLYVGSANPTNSGYYVRVDEGTVVGEVYIVSTFSLDSVLDLVDNPPLVAPTPEGTPADGQSTSGS
jgi:hypothetical protein